MVINTKQNYHLIQIGGEFMNQFDELKDKLRSNKKLTDKDLNNFINIINKCVERNLSFRDTLEVLICEAKMYIPENTELDIVEVRNI